MAQSYNRRINLYINVDGKEVKNNVKSIRGELNHLVNTQNQMTIGSEEYRKQTLKIQQLKTVLKGHAEAIGQIQTPLQKVIGFAKGLLPAFGLAALIGGIKSVFTNVIQVRKEFEKYEAVLTNTLGSNKKARQEMQMLQKFAAETPFALTELTGSFVKLTNYGLKPSRDEMRKYGDLASSVGKGFDQLAEAVADSVTGEFERLKEFGIKAKKEGDQITFTFKEQSTVVQNNADAIKNYIIGLGDLKGVSGSMAAIAETLGGKISNMGDAWDGLMNTMGSGTSGIFVTVIGWMTGFVNTLDGALKSVQLIKEAVKDKSVVDSMNNALKEIDVMEKSLVRNGMSQAEAHIRAIELYNKSIDDGIASTQASFNGKTTEQRAQLAKQLNFMIEERKAIVEHFKSLDEIKNNQKAAKNNGSKIIDEPNDIATKALDLGYKQQLLLLKQRYDSEETLQKEYKARMLAAEIAYMQTKIQLAGDEEAKIDLQSQLIDKQREYTAALKETVPEILNTDNGIQKLNTRLLEESELLAFAAQKQADGTAAQEDAIAKQKQQSDTIKMVGDVMTDYVTGALNGSLDGFQSFGDTLILMSLQILKQMVPIWSAQILGLSLASPESVATWGVAGMAKFAVITGLMYAGIAAVEGAVKGGMKKKQDSATKHATGGFTHGEATYIAGEAGTEWISPNWMLKNPVTGPLIYGLESYRRNPITLTPDIQKFADGGFTEEANRLNMGGLGLLGSVFGIGPSPTDRLQNELFQKMAVALDGFSNKGSVISGETSGNAGISDFTSVLQKNTDAINLNSQATALLMKRGVSFPMVAGIKKMKEVEDLINQTGMGGFKK